MLQELSHGHMSQGLVKINRNHITTALEAFRHASELEVSIHSLNLSGLCCYRLGRFNEAKAYWERSMQMGGEENPAHGYLAELNSPQMFALREDHRCALSMMLHKDYKGAARLLKQSDGMDHFVSFSNLMGLCCYAMKKPKKAYRYFLKALALDKDNPITHRYLRSVAGMASDKKACRQLLNTLLEV